MIVWVDAQLPLALAPWIEREFGIECRALRDVGLRGASDREIFNAANRGAVIMTKDSSAGRPEMILYEDEKRVNDGDLGAPGGGEASSGRSDLGQRGSDPGRVALNSMATG